MSHLLIYKTLLAFCKCQVYSICESQIKMRQWWNWKLNFFSSEPYPSELCSSPWGDYLRSLSTVGLWGPCLKLVSFCKVFLPFQCYPSFSPSSPLFSLFIFSVCSQFAFISYVEWSIHYTVGMGIKTVFVLQILHCGWFELELCDETAVDWSATTHQIRAKLLLASLALMKRHSNLSGAALCFLTAKCYIHI